MLAHFSSRIAHHRLCKRFPIHSEYHFRLLAPLCCSRTNVCSQTIGYLIFKEHLPQQPGSASEISFRVKSRRMLSIISRSSPDNVFESRFNKMLLLWIQILSIQAVSVCNFYAALIFCRVLSQSDNCGPIH